MAWPGVVAKGFSSSCFSSERLGCALTTLSAFPKSLCSDEVLPVLALAVLRDPSLVPLVDLLTPLLGD